MVWSKNFYQKFLLTLAVFFAAFCVSFSARSADLSKNSPLVLEIVADGYSLDSPIVAYEENNKIFVPLLEFAKGLEFKIQATSKQNEIRGWFSSESKKFRFDFDKKLITSDGKKFRFDDSEIKKNDDDFYVELELLKKIFFLKINFSKLDQSLQISAPFPLPFKEKLQRQNLWDKTLEGQEVAKRQKEKDSQIRQIKAPYNLATPPTVDLRYSEQYVKSQNETKGVGPRNSQLNLLASGDFLYLNNKIALNVLNGELRNAFISAGRSDSDGELLGPLKATEFTFGDVFSQQVPLISYSRAGIGAAITNYPTQYVNEVDSVPIRGVVQSGFDVEIYRNDLLIAFQKTGADGIYDFPQIQLLSGTNNIKIISYGPYGERREERKTFVLSSEILKKGNFYYRLSTNKNGKSIINNKANQRFVLEDDPKFGANRHFAEMAYGLMRNTSIAANYTEIPLGEKSQQYRFGGASLRSSVLGINGRFDVFKDLDNGFKAYQTSAQTSVGQVGLMAKLDQYEKNFISEEHQGSFSPLSRLTLKINTPLKIPFTTKDLRLTASRVEEGYENSQKRFIDALEASLGIFSNLNISQNLQKFYDERITQKNQRETKIGKTLLNYRPNSKLNFRSTLAYNLKPKKELTSLTVDGSYFLNTKTNITSSVTHQFENNNQKAFTVYGINTSRSIKDFTASIGTRFGNGYAIDFNLALSLGYDHHSKKFALSNIPLANSGSAALRVFVDENANGIFDEGEKLLEHIEFESEGSGQRVFTEKSGVAFITNLNSTSPTTIRLNNASIKEFYLASTRPTLVIKTHGGAMTKIDFPISIIGEIEGYAKIENKAFDVGGLNIELVNQDDEVVANSEIGSDGFFYFNRIPLGKYRLKLSEESIKNSGFGANDCKELLLTKEKQNLQNLSFILHKNSDKKLKNIAKKAQKKVAKKPKKKQGKAAKIKKKSAQKKQKSGGKRGRH